MTHTPGPWKVTKRDNGALDVTASGEWVALAAKSFDGPMLNPQGEADARLIAAAPALLEAMHKLETATAQALAKGHVVTLDVIRMWNTEARAAIAQAKGE